MSAAKCRPTIPVSRNINYNHVDIRRDSIREGAPSTISVMLTSKL